MQDVGENMDELFRKAADNYMLKNGESKWNEISSRLEPSVAPVPGYKMNPAAKYIIAILLLLLCFTAGYLFNYYTGDNRMQHSIVVKQSNTVKPNNTSTDSGSQIDKQQSPESKEAHEENMGTVPQKFRKSLTGLSTNNLTVNAGIINNNDPAAAIIPADNSFWKPITTGKTESNTIAPQDTQTVLNNTPLKSKEPGDLQPDDSSEHTATVKPVIRNKKSIYYGVLAGTGFTTVKSQNFSKPGFDIGIVAGYQFSAWSSVEINVLHSNKFYYTDGKYFNTSKMSADMPAGMKVMSLKGSSSLFEIPVKYKYNVIQQKQSVVYATAGISSYILVNEKNNYETSMNGTSGTMKGNYKKTSGYFAGALNISAGYQHNIGKNNTLRFEPYITIPTKGIGIGSLPVTTSGVHILFTIAPHK